MGHHADKFTVTADTAGTKYFLSTGSSRPFRRKYLALPGRPDVPAGLKEPSLPAGRQYADASADTTSEFIFTDMLWGCKRAR